MIHRLYVVTPLRSVPGKSSTCLVATKLGAKGPEGQSVAICTDHKPSETEHASLCARARGGRIGCLITDSDSTGPYDVWDTSTGQILARLERLS
jgi:hypothetical protein